MVRNYKRKKAKINEDTLLLAVRAVIDGMSMRSASIKFEVPRTTLIKHYRNNSPTKTEITESDHGNETAMQSESSTTRSIASKQSATSSITAFSTQHIEIKSKTRTKVWYLRFCFYWPI